jgi:hypothetical protein
MEINTNEALEHLFSHLRKLALPATLKLEEPSVSSLLSCLANEVLFVPEGFRRK